MFGEEGEGGWPVLGMWWWGREVEGEEGVVD